MTIEAKRSPFNFSSLSFNEKDALSRTSDARRTASAFISAVAFVAAALAFARIPVTNCCAIIFTLFVFVARFATKEDESYSILLV